MSGQPFDEFAEAIKAAVSQGLYVSMPGIVTAYDVTTRLASVQPAFMARRPNRADAQARPVLARVPVYQPRTRTAEMRLPVTVGDSVLLVFLDRPIGGWLSGDGMIPVEPDTLDPHALSNAVAILGGWPTGVGFDAGSPADAALALGAAAVKIQPAGTLTIGTEAADLIKVLSDTLAALITATAGGFPLTAPTLPALKIQLDTIKGAT